MSAASALVRSSIALFIILFVSLHLSASSSLSSSNLLDDRLLTASVFLSAASYCKSENYTMMDLTKAGPDVKVLDMVTNADYEMCMFIAASASQRELYIVFRGSHNLENFMTDANVFQIEYTCPSKNCHVHSGFYKAYQSISADVLGKVRKILSQDSHAGFTVICSGHSLGAALATLLAVDLTLSGTPVTLLNMGSPRVGDESFAKFVTATLPLRFRVTHGKDMVVHLPASSLSYVHIAEEWYQSPEKGLTLTECTNGFEDPSCSSQWGFTSLSIEDHMWYQAINMVCPWPELASHEYY